MEDLNEQTTGYLTVSFYDKDEVLAAPTAIQYRIDNVTEGQEVADWADFGSPADTIEIEITKVHSKILEDSNDHEILRVSVKAQYAGDDQVTGEYDLRLVNLRNLS